MEKSFLLLTLFVRNQSTIGPTVHCRRPKSGGGITIQSIPWRGDGGDATARCFAPARYCVARAGRSVGRSLPHRALLVGPPVASLSSSLGRSTLSSSSSFRIGPLRRKRPTLGASLPLNPFLTCHLLKSVIFSLKVSIRTSSTSTPELCVQEDFKVNARPCSEGPTSQGGRPFSHAE